MKKIIVFLIVILLLVGCQSTEKILSVNVNLNFDYYDWVSIDGVNEYTLTETSKVNSAFRVEEIELLKSKYGIFPYESEVLKDDISEYTNVLQKLLDSLQEEESIGGDLGFVGLKAKLTINLRSDLETIKLDFFQNENGEIVSLSITYIDSSNNRIIQRFESKYLEIYNEFTELYK